MIGTGELILILGVTTLLFGGKKLPEFARNLGKGLREFKRAAAGESLDEPEIIDIKQTNEQESKEKEKEGRHL